jgi:RHS repeat-associated protein
MLTLARMHAAVARGRTCFVTLLTAAFTFWSGAGPIAAEASADAALGTADGRDAPYTLDALTGAAVTVAAGRTPGEFGVTHSGAATYRIPLWTPPGIGDVDLDLALVYNSRGGNGTLGMGWSLTGLSSISRCNRTVAQDGAADGVTGMPADRFCLDGMQLKLTSGTYGAAGSVYATETETYARIVASGAAGYGPLSFTVTTRNGLVYEYGGTADSRVYLGNTATVRTWAVSRIRDRASVSNGNSIALTYQNDGAAGAYGNGSQRIATIAYPTPATGGTPYYTVSFEYSARPAGDVPIGYLAGSVIREPNQLDAITVAATGSSTPIKRYQLAYATAPTTGRLRLATVQECSASSCLRPTTIGYQDGASGWQDMAEAGVSASATRAPLPLDLNGDGRTDLLYPVDASGGTLAWWILLANGSGYGTPIDTGLVTNTSRIIPGQFSGNGRMQFLVQQNGYWYVAGYGRQGFTVTNTGLVPSGEYGAADLDGDGLDDLVAQSGGLTPTIVARRNVTVPSGGAVAAQFASTTQFIWSVPALRKSMPWDNVRVADFNGDGRADVLALSFTESERNPRFFATPLLSNGFGTAFTPGVERQILQTSMVALGDWNADGCSDIIQLRSVYISNCAGAFAEVGAATGPATGAELYTVLPADWNGDGRTDLLYVDAATEDWMVVPSTGAGAGPAVATGIDAAKTTLWFTHDPDGDGLADLGYRDGKNGQKLRFRLHAAAAVPPDLATRFTDGFGMTQSPAYASIARSHHDLQADAVFPEADFPGPLYVVSQFDAADGTGGSYRNELRYAGARVHLQGRGFEGFRSQRIRDSRTGFVTYDYVERTFPYTGMHVQRTVYQGDGTTPILHWQAQPSSRVAGGSGFEQRWFRFVASALERRFEFGGTLNGTPTSETNTAYVYGDGFGNPTQVQTSVTDRDPQSPFLDSSWQSTATYAWSNDSSANWCLGLPTSSSVTRSAPEQTAVTRTASYTVDSQACRLTQRVLEPGTPALKVTATYGYDACGNLDSLAVVGSKPSGSAMPARTARFHHGSRCQLPETVTNALGQATTYAWRYDFGVPTRTTDANGLSTLWSYDDFGRRTQETLPDGTGTAWSFESCSAGPCWGVADLRFLVYESRLAGDGTVIRSRYRFYDGHERLRDDEYHLAFGTWTIVDYRYDSLGRLFHVYRPYSAVTNGATRRSFDALGRLTSRQDLDVAGNVVGGHALSYAGRRTTVTDALGRQRALVHDVAGKLRRVDDPSPGGSTRYDYDGWGNLVRAQDAIGATSSATYNARGFRTRWVDADAGTWNFTGNSLNERAVWTDARGKSFSAAYDTLGRLVSRTDPEGKSTWVWGTSAAQHNIGRLQSRSGLGYSEALEYDVAGRVSGRTITSDQSYRYDFTYNTLGKLDTLTYPASPVPSGQTDTRMAIRFGYSHGALARIEDVTGAQPRPLWTLGAISDDGVPTLESLGGGVATATTVFDRPTGRVAARQAGAGGRLADRQDLAYQWDTAGNLTQRRDGNRGLTETFAYDALDRITGSSLNGVTNLSVTYDAAGNIRQKSDVGAYTYGNAAKPHAVTAAGSEKLAYDANGNVATRNGQSQTWASFNLPTLVRKAGQQSRFNYGPDRQRWRQVATYANGTETTHYIGGLLEKEATTSTGLKYWRHYVPTPGAATIVVSRNSDGSTSTRYLLADHAGSTDTVLDEAGGTVVSESYGAFGARRGSNWSSATAPDWAGIANSTRQGYTGHEMLDNLGLVHMGGRVYDPGLGRFLSVDPIVGDLADSQSVNPYAYVGNRPLRDVDPSGYDAVCGGVCTAVAVSVMRTAFNYLGLGHDHVLRPPATAIPGPSAQSGTSMCGAGTFSAVCGGTVLYASAPPANAGPGPGTSTWANEPVDDPHAVENLQRLFVDLGVNAADVLILQPYNDGRDAIEAAKRGEYLEAAILAGTTICTVAKPCKGAGDTAKNMKRLAKVVTKNGNEAMEVVQRAMSRAELKATLETGLLRGGRSGSHYVSDAVNSTATRAQNRLALPTTPEIRATIEVPTGVFSPSNKVAPYRLPNGEVLPGGGTERIGTGDVPARVIKVDEY